MNQERKMIFVLVLSMVIFTGTACKDQADSPDTTTAVQPAPASSLPTATLNLAGEDFTVELAFTDQSDSCAG